jgi:hypothetical protein
MKADYSLMKMKMLVKEIALLHLGISPEFMQLNFFLIHQENIHQVNDIVKTSM